MSKNAPWRAMHEALVIAGWTYVGISGGTHHKYRAPEGHTGRSFLILASSPGRGRAERNMRAQLRKQGINIGR